MAALADRAPSERAPLSVRKRILAACALVVLSSAYVGLKSWRDAHGFFINTTESLPNWAFFVDGARMPVRGDYVLFDPPRDPMVLELFGDPPVPFVKRAVGVAGDVVTRVGDKNFVNGKFAGVVKRISRMGKPLVAGPVGVVPVGCIYAGTPHKDSFDSRYGEIGFVCGKQILGVGVPVL